MIRGLSNLLKRLNGETCWRADYEYDFVVSFGRRMPAWPPHIAARYPENPDPGKGSIQFVVQVAPWVLSTSAGVFVSDESEEPDSALEAFSRLRPSVVETAIEFDSLRTRIVFDTGHVLTVTED